MAGGDGAAAPASSVTPMRMSSSPTVALALGGGGARGLAHIVVLEALDELGVRPVAIAGSSIGAVIGAAYAAGMSGKAIRRHVIERMQDRGEVLRRLMAARTGGLADLLPTRLGNPMLLDGEALCAGFLPAAIPEDFGALGIPLLVPTTDFFARSETVFDAGPLRPALAASMAVPGLIRPVAIGGRVLVDGGAVNPLPFDLLRGRADVVIAVDASIGPTAPSSVPDPWDALFSTIQLMGQTIVAEKLKSGAPALVLRPPVATFRLLDFLQVRAILRAAEPVRADLKTRLHALLR